MTTPPWPSGLPHNFLGLEGDAASWDGARVAVLPVPYDFTTSYQPGTRWGPAAIVAASRNMELWDEELGATYRGGVHTLPELEPTAAGPEAMARRVEQAVGWIMDGGKIPAMLGGEHSISAGAVFAAAARHKRLSVLQIDAHADMRDTYLDSPYSHACVMRRIREKVPAVSVGVRSMSEEEAQRLERHPVPTWSTRQVRKLSGDWKPVLASLTDDVYVTFDLDGLDPSILPGTGTPEPGGLSWFEAVDLLKAVSERSRIVGFDVVELAPIPGQVASEFLAARLTYRLMGLAIASASRVRT
jgi:agmatinase